MMPNPITALKAATAFCSYSGPHRRGGSAFLGWVIATLAM
jgi:hypothetical protein